MAFDQLVSARQASIDATNAYNERLKIVRAEQERGNWTCNADPEFRAMSDAQSGFYQIAQQLADTVLSEDGGHIWHERVFSSMKLKCCMNCGFIKNEDQPNKPCPGPIGVELRSNNQPRNGSGP